MLIQVNYLSLIKILLTTYLIDNEIIFNANSAVNRNVNLSSVISPVNPFVKPNIAKSTTLTTTTTTTCSGLNASTSIPQIIKLQIKEENKKAEKYSEKEQSDNEEEENNFFLKSKSIVTSKNELKSQVENYIPTSTKNDAPKDPRKKFKKK